MDPDVRFRPRSSALALLALVLVACGGATEGALPAQQPSTTSPVEAPPSGPQAGPEPAAPAKGGCGPFGARALDTKPAPLVGDRLRVTPPKGATSSTLPHDIMAAPTADEDETRLMLEEGEHKLVIYAHDLAATADLAVLGSEGARAAARAFDLDVATLVPVPLHVEGLDVVAFRPRARVERAGGVPLLLAITATKDGSATLFAVFVDPASVDDRCDDVALRIASTLAPGARVRAAPTGPIELSGVLAIEAPSGWQYVKQHGPDFDVHHLRKLAPLGQDGSRIGVYVGTWPQKMEPAPTTKAGTLAGRPVTWRVRRPANPDENWSMETQMNLGGKLTAHVWITAPSESELDAARVIAERMKARR